MKGKNLKVAKEETEVQGGSKVSVQVRGADSHF